MGVIANLISTKIEDFILNTVEKRTGFPVKGFSYAPPGDDSPGLPEDRHYIAKKDGQGNIVVIGTLVVSQGAKEGEKILYSRNSDGDTVAKIYFQNDGKLTIETDDEINIIGSKKTIVDSVEDIEIKSNANLVLQNGSDFAMRFNEFETQINQIKQDINDHINVRYTPHTHIVPQAPSGTTVSQTPLPVGIPSTVDFSNVKIDNINLPGLGK